MSRYIWAKVQPLTSLIVRPLLRLSRYGGGDRSRVKPNQTPHPTAGTSRQGPSALSPRRHLTPRRGARTTSALYHTILGECAVALSSDKS